MISEHALEFPNDPFLSHAILMTDNMSDESVQVGYCKSKNI